MAFTGDTIDLSDEKKTDYALDGKQITIGKKRGRPPIIRNPLFFTQDKKVETCSMYVVIGDIKKVSELTDVPEKFIREWKEEPWWTEIQKKIMVEQNEGLLGKINSTIDIALVVLEDRIINGDCVYMAEKIGKDGNIVSEEKTVRVPVKARDLSAIFHSMTHQRNLLSGNPTEIRSTTTTAKRLDDLSEHFKKFSQAKEIDGEVKVITEISDAHT